MSLGKALLIGAAGLAAGLLIAAWAETMDSDSSDTDTDLDLDDTGDYTYIGDSDETIESETDETLTDQIPQV
ncbi:MAG TPA: hypothetical protein PLK90_08390 [Clostridiales bacterium]|nr:hypothetical protein [Clostridiales bacterium]HQP70400.1 hypothetical protein [Clostridiales bacterium]